MKLLTINTHSLIEPNYENKLVQFVDMVSKERPDLIAMQEVNQLTTEDILPDEMLKGFIRNPDYKLPIRRGNHAARVAELLNKKGLFYEWTFLSAKLGYGKYDEGMAIFSLKPIIDTKQICISHTCDYQNWKTRKCLGVKLEGMENSWFYSVHMGWWDDEEEPFANQWDSFMEQIDHEQTIWLLGDFNSPDTVQGQGYSYVRENGWYDCHTLAYAQDSGITVESVIDGWENRSDGQQGIQRMRLDYIFCNKKIPIVISTVIFNGKNYPVISDHYGLMMEVEIE